MTGQGVMMADCGVDVTVVFSESLFVYTDLLSVASVCGALCGVLAAALLYVFCLKPLLLTRQVNLGSLVVNTLCSHFISSSPFHNLRAITRGGCWSLMTTTTVTVSAGRRRPLRPPRKKYDSVYNIHCID